MSDSNPYFVSKWQDGRIVPDSVEMDWPDGKDFPDLLALNGYEGYQFWAVGEPPVNLGCRDEPIIQFFRNPKRNDYLASINLGDMYEMVLIPNLVGVVELVNYLSPFIQSVLASDSLEISAYESRWQDRRRELSGLRYRWDEYEAHRREIREAKKRMREQQAKGAP